MPRAMPQTNAASILIPKVKYSASCIKLTSSELSCCIMLFSLDIVILSR